jgi:hypothetical protein
MSRIRAAKWCLALAGAAALVSSAAFPQEAPPKLPTFYYGNGSCVACHENASIEETRKKKLSVVFTRGTEMTIWSTEDKHKDATKVLLGERGKQMTRILGIKDVLAEKQCVSCHGVYVAKGETFDEETFSPRQRVESGVSCVLCHGPHEKWVMEHAVFGGWRKKTREEKSASGLNDLWNPELRATLCAACHVGNAKEEKVVTHEMYAAGHPPLPGLEVTAFCEAMPRHWETWSEKLARMRADEEKAKNAAADPAPIRARAELYRKAYHFDAHPPETQQLDLATTGAVVVFRESMRLLRSQAMQGIDAKDERLAWPELAAFDCYACHHDLKAKSWRQKRGFKGAPGRPDMRPWSLALLPFSLEHLAQAGKQAPAKRQTEALHANLRDLEKAFSAQPFGEPKAIAEKAAELVRWSDALLAELRTCRTERAGARRLLLGLAELPSKHMLDFDSARQIAWAFVALAPEVWPELLQRKKGQAMVEVKHAGPWPELQAALAALDSCLQLELPQGQTPIVPQFLAAELPKIAEYDPERFRSQMSTVRRMLGQRKPPGAD